MTSLHSLMPSDRAATMRLSSSTEHTLNDYDFLRGDYYDLQRSYDGTATTTVCCDDEYLTPGECVTCQPRTTATMQSYDSIGDVDAYETMTGGGRGGQRAQDPVYYNYI